MAAATSNIQNPTQFSQAVLASAGWPATASNVQFLNEWQGAEGQWAATGSWFAGNNMNPLNLESIPQGSSATSCGSHAANSTNSILVFCSWLDGVTATSAFINQPNYPAIQGALQQGNALQQFQSGALNNDLSTWGTNPANFSTPQVNQSPGSGGSVTAGGSLTAGAGASTSAGPTTLMQNCYAYGLARNQGSSSCLVSPPGGWCFTACEAKAFLSFSILVAGGLLMLVGISLVFAGGHGVAGKAAELAGAGVALVPGGEAVGAGLMKVGHSESLRSKNKQQAQKAQKRGGPRDTLSQRRNRQAADNAYAQEKGRASSNAARNKSTKNATSVPGAGPGEDDF